MQVIRPRDLGEALDVLHASPDTVMVAGGTDVMVAINFGRLMPSVVMDIRPLEELRSFDAGDTTVCGAGCTYSSLLGRLQTSTPSMVQAMLTIGSPQIRNAGTIGGNLGTCSPAGDALPVLSALDAVIVVRSAVGERRIPFDRWMVGPKRPARRPDELIVAVEWKVPCGGQVFMKAGSRNAMVIAVASLAMVVDTRRRSVRVAIGSAGPTVLRATAAERLVEEAYEQSGWESPPVVTDTLRTAFAGLVAGAARPIDDVRGSAAYRRHVLGVMAGRALDRTVGPGQ